MEHKQSFFQRIGKDKRYIVFNLFFAYFALGVALIMLGSVLPVLKAEYALNYQVGGMLLSVQSIGYAVAGLGAGFLPLYLGLKKSFILLTSGTCIGMGMLLASGNPVWLLTAMGLIGISKGAVTNYNNQIMTELAEGDAGPLNLMHAFFAIGACIAPFIVLLCGKVDASGWRLAVFLSAAAIRTLPSAISTNAAAANSRQEIPMRMPDAFATAPTTAGATTAPVLVIKTKKPMHTG